MTDSTVRRGAPQARQAPKILCRAWCGCRARRTVRPSAGSQAARSRVRIGGYPLARAARRAGTQDREAGEAIRGPPGGSPAATRITTRSAAGTPASSGEYPMLTSTVRQGNSVSFWTNLAVLHGGSADRRTQGLVVGPDGAAVGRDQGRDHVEDRALAAARGPSSANGLLTVVVRARTHRRQRLDSPGAGARKLLSRTLATSMRRRGGRSRAGSPAHAPPSRKSVGHGVSRP